MMPDIRVYGCRRAAPAMSDETQALCFLAGANSIFVGDTLLTAGNPEHAADRTLFQRLGLQASIGQIG